MPSEDTKILESKQYRKSDKTPSIVYADLESLIKRTDGCKYNSENSSTNKVGEHMPFLRSISTIWTFDAIENNYNKYRNEDSMKKFCEFLREHAMKIINFEKKKIKRLTNEQQEWHEKTNICYNCKKKFEYKYTKDKNHRKMKDHCHYKDKYKGDVHGICNLKYSILKENHVAFHNESNHDYKFTVKEFEGEFNRLG